MSTLIRNLKTLFKSFIYYREDDENNTHTWTDSAVTYTEGSLKFKYTGTPLTSLHFIGEKHPEHDNVWIGEIKGTLTPGIKGLTITIEDPANKYFLITDNNGAFTTKKYSTIHINDPTYPAGMFHNLDITNKKIPITIHIPSFTYEGTVYPETNSIRYLEDGVLYDTS